MMNYTVNARVYQTCDDLKTELTIPPQVNCCFELDYLTTVLVEGENALSFLQGQLSCDTRQVTPLKMQQGVMCNLKGRVLAIIDVVLWKNQGVHLVIPSDLAQATIASLSKAAALSRVTLKHNPRIQLFGFMLQNDENSALANIFPDSPYGVVSGDALCAYKIDQQFAMVMVDPKGNNRWAQIHAETEHYRGSLAWHLLQLKQHRVEIYPESRGLFLPHRIDLHRLGHLNFDKGCYKGQEIVARMHFRSTIKHHLAHFQISVTYEQLHSGMVVYDAHDNTVIGELIDISPIDANNSLIVVSILLNFTGEARVENLGSFFV